MLTPWVMVLVATGVTLGAPLLIDRLNRNTRFRHWLSLALTLATGMILIFEVLPHTIEQLGIWALGLALVGAGLPGLIEHLFHKAARATHIFTLGFGIVGLAMHAAMDGMSFTEVHLAQGGLWLALAVVLHRLPISMALWWLCREAFGTRTAWALLMALVAGTWLGFLYTDHLLESVMADEFAQFQALMSGMLLHSLIHRPHEHACHSH